jgi:hypothetical protein
MTTFFSSFAITWVVIAVIFEVKKVYWAAWTCLTIGAINVAIALVLFYG